MLIRLCLQFITVPLESLRRYLISVALCFLSSQDPDLGDMLSLQRLVIRNTTLQSAVILHTRLERAWIIQVSNAKGGKLWSWCFEIKPRGVFPHQHVNRVRWFNVFCFYFLDFLVFSSDCSPGPGYKIDPRITRAGVDGTPSYSMLGRQRDQRKYIYHTIL